MHRPTFVLVAIVLVGLALGGCRGPRQRAWTKEQERQVAAAMLSERPTPQIPVDAVFDDALRLIGVDLDRTSVRPGDSLTVTWYWESLAEAQGDWKPFVHFEGRGRREPFDHDPVGELLPVNKLKPGQIIKDVQVMSIPADFPEGEVRIWTGVFDPVALRERQQDVRMRITNPDAVKVPHEPNQRVHAATVQVSKAAAKAEGAARPVAPARPDRRSRRYTAHRAPGPIVVDGKIDDPGWVGVPRVSDFVTPQEGEAIDEARRPEARMTWDDQFLYVAFHNPDTNIRNDFSGRDATLWEADVVEIYLDPGADGKDYLELQVAPTGEIFDAKFTSRRTPDWKEAAPAFTIDMVAKVAVDGTVNSDEGEDRSWTVEVAIPFAQIPGAGGPPVADAVWSINLYRLDQGFHAAWSPAGNDYHNLPGFGRVVFTPVPPVEAPAPAPAPVPAPTPAPEGTPAPAPAPEGTPAPAPTPAPEGTPAPAPTPEGGDRGKRIIRRVQGQTP